MCTGVPWTQPFLSTFPSNLGMKLAPYVIHLKQPYISKKNKWIFVLRKYSRDENLTNHFSKKRKEKFSLNYTPFQNFLVRDHQKNRVLVKFTLKISWKKKNTPFVPVIWSTTSESINGSIVIRSCFLNSPAVITSSVRNVPELSSATSALVVDNIMSVTKLPRTKRNEILTYWAVKHFNENGQSSAHLTHVRRH